ncbi:MAG: diaminopimelate epimerase [Pirellulales bacterium]|nr:diaminopimelate epimerase [Pirellulales bacterium]
MRFTKLQGAGNDYVYIEGFTQAPPADPAALARRIADRHFGVGGDGLILILPSDVADARMQMFNADGSESGMCGNGIRCVAKYVYDHGIAPKTSLKIETGRGILPIELELRQGKAARATVNMGEPILEAKLIPTTLAGKSADSPVVNASLTVADKHLTVTCVSMGNPHCITYVPELNDDWVLRIGPLVEQNSHFPQRVNAEFVQILSPTEVRLRVWERGSGETLACGTGASAVCVAGVLTGQTERRLVTHLPGGDLELEWDAATNQVFMTGPAVEVFSGEWPDEV